MPIRNLYRYNASILQMKSLRETMKKLLFLFPALLMLASCSTDDGNTIPFHIEFLKIKDVYVPQYVTPGYEYDVIVTYERPTDCHYFDGFYYKADGPEHTVALQMMVLEDIGCQPLAGDVEEVKFKFLCKSNYEYDYYTFKFYEGQDEVGNQSFREVHVSVEQ